MDYEVRLAEEIAKVCLYLEDQLSPVHTFTRLEPCLALCSGWSLSLVLPREMWTRRDP